MIASHYSAIERVAHHLVKSFGAKGFALMLKKTPSTVCNEVNPSIKGAKLGVVDAVRMMQLAANYELLQQICLECGYVAVPMPKSLRVSSCVLQSLTHWQAKFGETAQIIHWALEDNLITPNEKTEIQRSGLEKIGAFMNVMTALEPLEVRHGNR